MKFRLILFFCLVFFFKNSLSSALEKISYVDMDKLLTMSEAGKSISLQLKEIHKKNLIRFKDIEDDLKKDEARIIKQKNIMKKEELDKKLVNLRKKASTYQKERKKANNELNKKRLESTALLVNLIKPILAEYVNQNKISIIFQKKNIIIGKTELDITDNIMLIINEKHKNIEIK
jgi:outer membrane protein